MTWLNGRKDCRELGKRGELRRVKIPLAVTMVKQHHKVIMRLDQMKMNKIMFQDF
jgi:hypothetical protein